MIQDLEEQQMETNDAFAKLTYDSTSKGAKSDTFHTNLFITYYDDVLGPFFFFFLGGWGGGGLKLKDSRVFEKEIRRSTQI